MRSSINTRLMMRSEEVAVDRNRGGPSFEITPGSTGDHLAVPGLLRAAGVVFSEEDFVSRLDEPSYEPSDRRVARKGGRVIAHAQAMHRMAWFGGNLLPCGGLTDIAVLPEYRTAGVESQVLHSAESLLRRGGAIVAICNTNRSELLTHSGWSQVDCQGRSQVCVRDLLTHLSPRSTPPRRPRGPKIRVWRRVELDALMPVYRDAAQNSWGVMERSEPYWRWMCGRHPDCVVMVACDPAKSGKVHPRQMILAYAVIRGEHIVEFRHRQGHELAGPPLLARVCQDAIEQDCRVLNLHAPATDPMHELLITAGGTWLAPSNGNADRLMVKLLNPEAWIDAMAPLWQSRLAAAGTEVPLSIGFHVGDHFYQLVVSSDGARLQQGVPTAEDVVCQPATFNALLLGNGNPRLMIALNELEVRSDHLARLLAVLFSPAVYWQSPLDCNG